MPAKLAEVHGGSAWHSPQYHHPLSLWTASLRGADTTTPPCRDPNVATPRSRLFSQLRVCGRSVAATTPPKGPVAPHPGPTCGVSQVVWTSETLSRSRGWSSYACECRATLWHEAASWIEESSQIESCLSILDFTFACSPASLLSFSFCVLWPKISYAKRLKVSARIYTVCLQFAGPRVSYLFLNPKLFLFKPDSCRELKCFWNEGSYQTLSHHTTAA